MKNGTVVFEGVPLKAGSNEVTVTAGPVFDQAVWQRVDTPEPSYALPSTGEGPVRNWFLQDDDIRREGYFSLYDTANDLLENPESKAVLDRFIPGLVKVMTTKSVIPLGLTLKSILEHDPDEALDVTAVEEGLVGGVEARDEPVGAGAVDRQHAVGARVAGGGHHPSIPCGWFLEDDIVLRV